MKNQSHVFRVILFLFISFIWFCGCTHITKTGSDRSGKAFTNSIGMKFVYIKPGEFMMGSKYGHGFEKPIHKVRITKGFYMGVYEVTQEQYEKVMGTNPSKFKGADLPVETVSRKDAKEFCRKLSEKEGETYRLPMEAEWEYACRAGSKTEYYWGNDMKADYCWYDANSESKTHKVGTRKPNKWGLYDMSGNVWEWSQDNFREYTENDEIDPQGPEGAELTAELRGGSYDCKASLCRSAQRNGNNAAIAYFNWGFRIVRISKSAESNEPEDVAGAINTKEPKKPDNAEKNLKPKKGSKSKNSIGMEFVYIKPGKFMMGSKESAEEITERYKLTKEEFAGEKQHEVEITKGFYIQRTEVTQAQWKKVMGTEPWKDDYRHVHIGDKFPAACILYEDAKVFCEKLSRSEGKTYRLPTEAEWEYACRAGEKDTFQWGNNPDDGKGCCNVFDLYAISMGYRVINLDDAKGTYFNFKDGYLRQSPVGIFRANRWGLYDMVGNVAEWCEDWYDEEFYSREEAKKDPCNVSFGNKKCRVVRGGSCSSIPGCCRSAYRFKSEPTYPYHVIGFRVVRTSE